MSDNNNCDINEPLCEDLPARFFFAGDQSRRALARPFLKWVPSYLSRHEHQLRLEPGHLHIYDAHGEDREAFYKGWRRRIIAGVDCFRHPFKRVAVAVWPIDDLPYRLVYVFALCCSDAPLLPLGPTDLARHHRQCHRDPECLGAIPPYSQTYRAPNLKDVGSDVDIVAIMSALGSCYYVRDSDHHYIPAVGDVYVLAGRVGHPLDGGSAIQKCIYYFGSVTSAVTIVHYVESGVDDDDDDYQDFIPIIVLESNA